MNSFAGASLKQRVLKAGLWSSAGFLLSLVLRFGSNLLMTRLLMPEMFGLMAVASTVMVGLGMFSDFGLRQFVVQSTRGGNRSYLNTAWIIQIYRGAMLCGAGACLSLGILVARKFELLPNGSVYSAPSLPPILAALSLSAVVAGFASTKLLEANRALTLGMVTRNDIVAQLAGFGAMVAWASADRSVWALVAGAIGSAVTRTTLSHIWLPGLPNRWEWDRSAANEILKFGRWILLASVLGFLVNSGDQLLLAGFLDSASLGLYVIASLYIGSIESILARVMSDVAFPTFSEIARERRSDFKKSYYRFHLVIAAVAYFGSGFLMAAGQTLIDVLYDRRYQSAGQMIAILAPILVTVPFRMVTQSFLALGKPELQSHILLIRLIFLAVLTPLGFYSSGLTGALCGVVLSHFAYVPLIIFYNLRHELFDLRREFFLLPLFPLGLALGYAAPIVGNFAVHFWRMR